MTHQTTKYTLHFKPERQAYLIEDRIDNQDMVLFVPFDDMDKIFGKLFEDEKAQKVKRCVKS